MFDKAIGAIVFIIIWCAFCAGQQYVFEIESPYYLMTYGYLAGHSCVIFYTAIVNSSR